MELFEVTGIWMHAIGKTILHSIWIGLLVLAMLRLVLVNVPARLPGLRYGISVAALLLLFFSVLTVFLLIYEPGSSGDTAGLQLLDLRWTGNQANSNKDLSILHAGRLFTLMGYLYLAGVLFMLVRSLRSLAQISDLQKSGLKPPSYWQERFLKLCHSMGISRSVLFLESRLVSAPQLVTLAKPAVIVPVGMLTNLPVSQVETILIHELYHLKRKDYLFNFMQLFMEGILFYHPAVWLISAHIRNEREHCCDDQVLRSTENPLIYAKALIQVAEKQHFTRLSPGAIGSEKRQFYSRIKRILNQNTMKANLRDKVLTFSLLAVSVSLFLALSAFNAASPLIKGNDIRADIQPDGYHLAEIVLPDTIPDRGPLEAVEEQEEPDWEALEKDLEAVKEKALQEIEEIDWEAIEQDMEIAHQEALKEIEEIDWEGIKEEMVLAREEALKEIEEIDWEEVRAELEQSIAEMKLDMEQMKMEIENSIHDINWDEIREDIKEDLEKARIHLDSIKIERDN